MKPTLLAALALIALPLAATTTATPAPLPLTIDTQHPAQQILGFGASGCWWAQTIGGWPGEKRREILRLLFDKQTGLGLTIYRHNLGADTLDDTAITRPDRRAQSMLDTKATPPRYDWTRDANARRVLHEAVAAGADEVILFVNSPPVNMTKNGRGYCDKQPDGKNATNLAPGRHADFAAYLGEVTEHFLRVEKLPIVALSPVNEPEWDWTKTKQEGCYYTPAETAAVLRAAHDELKRRALPVRVEGPEGGSWESTIPYFEAITADPELRAGMKDLCVHSYWSTNEQRKKLRAWLDKNRPDIRLHMSEWCEMKSGAAPGMDGALSLARTIIDDFTLGGAVTWQYWVALHPPVWQAGMLYFSDDAPEYTITKRYWVFGQFTRYLTKGSVVLPLKMPASEKLYESASGLTLRAMSARLPDGRVAVICANLSDSEKLLKIQFPKNENWRQQFRVLTDENNNNTETPPADTLPPQSVVTLIFEKQN